MFISSSRMLTLLPSLALSPSVVDGLHLTLTSQCVVLPQVHCQEASHKVVTNDALSLGY